MDIDSEFSEATIDETRRFGNVFGDGVVHAPANLDHCAHATAATPERSNLTSSLNNRSTPEEDIQKKHEAKATVIANRLIGQGLINSFTENYEKTTPDWISLLGQTVLPSDITSSDSRIIAAFRAVDSIICGQQGTFLLRRLAYVQLMRLFSFLEAVIKSDRENGRVFRKPCYRDASVAIDIYMTAQETSQNAGDLRRELKERKRRGRRWSELARPSPLFVLVYSDAAEQIINDFKYIGSA
ncbi:hypothetical protein B0H63DRAFT_435866, partial [Podospora didyma]